MKPQRDSENYPRESARNVQSTAVGLQDRVGCITHRSKDQDRSFIAADSQQ